MRVENGILSKEIITSRGGLSEYDNRLYRELLSTPPEFASLIEANVAVAKKIMPNVDSACHARTPT